MNRLTRRDFMRLGAGAAIALGASPILKGCGGEEAVPKPSPTPQQPFARVAAIRGDNLHSMTRDALEALGGAQRIVKPGETVFIKPNFVSLPFATLYNPFALGECTKPEIVIAVAEECLRAGAKEVIIGDGSQMPTFDWRYATTMDGSTNLLAERERLRSKYDGEVTLACLETDSPAWAAIPSRTHLGEISISGLVAQADRVISIPVMKTHVCAHLTLSLKNFIGVTPLAGYSVWSATGDGGGAWLRIKGLDHSSPEALAGMYLDIVDAVRPDLTIIDASIGLEGDGPTIAFGGATVDMKDRLGSWLLLASTDLVAADATAARIMTHDVAGVVQLGMAHERGLGEMQEESIEIVGERLDNLRVEWSPAKIRPFPPPSSWEGQRYRPDRTPAYVAGPHMAHWSVRRMAKHAL